MEVSFVRAIKHIFIDKFLFCSYEAEEALAVFRSQPSGLFALHELIKTRSRATYATVIVSRSQSIKF